MDFTNQTATQTIQQELNLPDGAFTLSDFDKDAMLAVVKINPGFPQFMKYNTAVFDLEAKRVICPPVHEENYEATANTILTSADNYIIITADGTGINLPVGRTVIRKGYEGTILRMMYHKGKTYFLTSNRLDAKGKWVTSRPFMELFEELGGPVDLFDDEAIPRSLILYFIICHPELQSVSQDDVGEGRLILLKVNYQDPSITYDDYHLETLNRDFDQDPPLTLEQAHKVLQGDEEVNDSRAGGGGYVIMTCGNMAVKVTSKAYAWRTKVRSDDANIDHLVYSKISDANNKGKFAIAPKTFLEKYMIFEHVDTADIEARLASNLPLGFHATHDQEYPEDHSTRVHQIVMNLVLAVPPHMKERIIELYKGYFRKRSSLAKWIAGLEAKGVVTVFDELSPQMKEEYAKHIKRITQIVTTARKNAYEKKTGDSSPAEEIAANISRLISWENGSSMYRLFKFMDVLA